MKPDYTLDECAAQSNRAIAELAELRTNIAILKYMIKCAPRGVSHSADFDAMTWSFLIGQGTTVSGGEHALVRLLDNNSVL